MAANNRPHTVQNRYEQAAGAAKPPRKEIEMEHFNEKDVEIIMSTGRNERKAKRELEEGSYVMELRDFLDYYRETPEEMKASGEIDNDGYAEEAEHVERVISAITETAEHIKNFSDGYFETADEFNTVVNFDGKQCIIHWTL